MSRIGGRSGARIVVFGLGGVGKSCLILRFVNGEFESEYQPTIEDFYKKTMYVDGKEEHIEIFDTAGQEEYMILQDQWIKEGNCFLVLFAVNEKGSLEKTLSLVDKIRELHDDSMPILIVGHKCDLDKSEWTTSEDRVYSCAQEAGGLPVVFASAKENINVDKVFHDIVALWKQSCEPEQTETKPKACCSIL